MSKGTGDPDLLEKSEMKDGSRVCALVPGNHLLYPNSRFQQPLSLMTQNELCAGPVRFLISRRLNVVALRLARIF